MYTNKLSLISCGVNMTFYSISLEPLFMEGSLPPTAYNVVKNQEYCGEIRLGLTFTPEVTAPLHEI